MDIKLEIVPRNIEEKKTMTEQLGLSLLELQAVIIEQLFVRILSKNQWPMVVAGCTVGPILTLTAILNRGRQTFG